MSKKTTLSFTIGNFDKPGIRIQLSGFDFDLKDERNKTAAEIVVRIIGAELYAFSCGVPIDEECIIGLANKLKQIQERAEG